MDWEVYVSWVKYIVGELGRHEKGEEEKGEREWGGMLGKAHWEGEVRYRETRRGEVKWRGEVKLPLRWLLQGENGYKNGQWKGELKEVESKEREKARLQNHGEIN